jgi:hypothetical protein
MLWETVPKIIYTSIRTTKIILTFFLTPPFLAYKPNLLLRETLKKAQFTGAQLSQLGERVER